MKLCALLRTLQAIGLQPPRWHRARCQPCRVQFARQQELEHRLREASTDAPPPLTPLLRNRIRRALTEVAAERTAQPLPPGVDTGWSRSLWTGASVAGLVLSMILLLPRAPQRAPGDPPVSHVSPTTPGQGTVYPAHFGLGLPWDRLTPLAGELLQIEAEGTLAGGRHLLLSMIDSILPEEHATRLWSGDLLGSAPGPTTTPP
jgi:hypothetical protein